MVQWPRRRAAGPKDAGSVAAVMAAFKVEAKGENAHVLKFRCKLSIHGGQN